MRYLIPLCFILLSNYASADTRIGNVYDVAEEDPVKVIRAKAEQTDWDDIYSNRKESWRTELRAEYLPRASTNTIRYHKPEHTLEREIIDKNGDVVYPKGYTFNTLDFVTMPYRIFVIDESDAEWASSRLRFGDKILLNKGGITSTAKTLKTKIYILDKLTRKTLTASSVPCVIEQKGNTLQIREFVNAL